MLGLSACAERQPAEPPRFSGYVEATDIRIATEVPGRLLALRVEEGSRVSEGEEIARLDTTDTELALARAAAEREQATAQLRLVLAGSRNEDIRQAQAHAAAAEGELAAAQVEAANARTDLARFEDLLARHSGSRKQRDDAAARADVATQRVQSAAQRLEAAREVVGRLQAGPRSQEVDVARQRVAVVDAQIAALREPLTDAVIKAPSAGVVTEKLVEPGELLGPRAAIAILTDLDRAWATVYVDEPTVPRVRLGQTATVFTDAGGAGLPGTVSYVSPRAEFTPRNVQTAEERSKLVYRVKVAVDNRNGLLKPGMPVEAEIGLDPVPTQPAQNQ